MRWRAVRRTLAVACLMTVVGAGCTPDSPPPPPPTPAVPTPTENAQEREQRLAYEAAETSYREFSVEFRRVTAAGGAKRATNQMKATAAGPYLADSVKTIRAYKKTGGYTTGQARFGYVRPAGYSRTSLILDVCEDETSVRTFNAKHKQVAKNGILVLRLDIHKINGYWKLWDYSGKEDESCE